MYIQTGCPFRPISIGKNCNACRPSIGFIALMSVNDRVNVCRLYMTYDQTFNGTFLQQLTAP